MLRKRYFLLVIIDQTLCNYCLVVVDCYYFNVYTLLETFGRNKNKTELITILLINITS
jgi:hypothetical protein